jgi:hypothetical protein
MSRLCLRPSKLLDNIVSHLLASQNISHLSLTCRDLRTKTTEFLKELKSNTTSGVVREYL